MAESKKPGDDVVDTVEDAGRDAEAAVATVDDSPMSLDNDPAAGGGFAATALKLLIVVLVIFGLSLWLVPLAAPYLPTSIAKHIMPGKQELDERLANLEKTTVANADTASAEIAAMRGQLSELTARLAAAEEATAAARADAETARAEAERSAQAATSTSVAEDVVAQAEEAARTAASTAETAAAAATEAGKVAAAATRDTASLARQMTTFEGRLGTLRSELAAVGENLTAMAEEDGGVSATELAAAFATLKGRVDVLVDEAPDVTTLVTKEEAAALATTESVAAATEALRAEIGAAVAALPDGGVLATVDALGTMRSDIDGEISALSTDIEAVKGAAEAAAEAAKGAEAASAEALSRVGSAIRGASVDAAVVALESRYVNGLSFAGEMDELASLVDAAPGDALTAVAATGVATPEAMAASFGPAAQSAIEADFKASAGDDLLDQTGARISSIFAGRPKDAQDGDDTTAVLSRIESQIAAGALVDALAEAQTLSDAAKAGLGGWLDNLRARVAADGALEAWIAELGGSQG